MYTGYSRLDYISIDISIEACKTITDVDGSSSSRDLVSVWLKGQILHRKRVLPSLSRLKDMSGGTENI